VDYQSKSELAEIPEEKCNEEDEDSEEDEDDREESEDFKREQQVQLEKMAEKMRIEGVCFLSI
jgi:hypothetical protein